MYLLYWSSCVGYPPKHDVCSSYSNAPRARDGTPWHLPNIVEPIIYVAAQDNVLSKMDPCNNQISRYAFIMFIGLSVGYTNIYIINMVENLLKLTIIFSSFFVVAFFTFRGFKKLPYKTLTSCVFFLFLLRWLVLVSSTRQ